MRLRPELPNVRCAVLYPPFSPPAARLPRDRSRRRRARAADRSARDRQAARPPRSGAVASPPRLFTQPIIDSTSNTGVASQVPATLAAIASATMPSIRPCDFDLRQLAVAGRVHLHRRVGRAHAEHRMPAVPQPAIQHQRLERQQRRRHRLIALAERLEDRSVALKLLLGKAGIGEQRLQVPPAPAVEGDPPHVVGLAEVPEERGDKPVIDGRARRRLQEALRVPDVVGHPVGRRLLAQPVARKPERRPDVPDLVDRRHRHKRRQVGHARQVEPGKHRQAGEVRHHRRRRMPSTPTAIRTASSTSTRWFSV